MSMGIDQEEKEPDDVDIKDFLIDIFEKNKSEVNDLRDSLKIAVREFQSERKRYQNAYVSIVKSSREKEHYKYWECNSFCGHFLSARKKKKNNL